MVIINGSFEQSFEADLFKIGSIKHSLLSDQGLQLSFLDRFHENVLLDTVFSDQSVNGYVSGLANSMASILSLLVHGWIPVSIIENDITGTCQIQSDTS